MSTIVAVLGGDIEQVLDVWRSKKWQALRVAAASLCAQQTNTTLFLQGGYGTSGRPSLAAVMKEELVALGVASHMLVLEEQSHSTFAQLSMLQRYLETHTYDTIQILSNDWHLPRIAALLSLRPELSVLYTLKPILCAAEEVLKTADSKKWQLVIDATSAQEDMAALIAKEAQGVADLKRGTYYFK